MLERLSKQLSFNNARVSDDKNYIFYETGDIPPLRNRNDIARFNEFVRKTVEFFVSDFLTLQNSKRERNWVSNMDISQSISKI